MDSRVPAVPGLRRDPAHDPAGPGSDLALVALLRDEIAARGPMTFARFMERALYEPGHGYYRRAEPGPGTAGDFLTAPEAHPIFGAALGRLLEQAWEALGRPDPFVVTEPGAGTGALAAGLLGGLRDLGSPLAAAVRYRPLEVEPARLAALGARLAGAGLADALVAGPPGPGETGAVVANEVLDALPVHRVVGRAGGLRELLVGLAPGEADPGTRSAGRDAPGGARAPGGAGVPGPSPFAWVEAEPSTPALAARLAAEGVTLGEGEVTEVCLALDGWLAGTTAHLLRGVVVLVDYGEDAGALHGPGRPHGTLRTFLAHGVGADPFRDVGRADLTAHVDWTAVRAAAAAAGLAPLGETTQAELLATLASGGLVDAVLRAPGTDLQAALALRSALARLLDPRGMGGFRVVAFARGLPPGTALPGLARVPRPGPAGPAAAR